MGSLVLNTFQPAMFGSTTRQHSHESSGIVPLHHRKSAPLRPPQQDAAASATASAVDQVDTPMADAPPQAAVHPPTIGHGHHTDEMTSSQGPSSRSASDETPMQDHPTNDTLTINAPHAPPLGRQGMVPPSAGSSVTSSPISLMRSPLDSATGSPRRIKVKSLSHIQSFATDEMSPYSQTRAMSRRARRDPNDAGPQYEISEMPVADIIEMVAGLLTKITTTNDRQHEHLHRQIPPPDTSGLSQETTSVLAFHGKNVPSISILSYLSRIHKYCPTTYEVFLSLLVYFDRMTERVNAGPLIHSKHVEADRAAAAYDGSRHSSVSTAPLSAVPQSSNNPSTATPPDSGSPGKPANSSVHDLQQPPSPPQIVDPPLHSDPYNLSHFFVVDSYNIHRLVIAGVTCASKFFSDVFYTNSRYAKVSTECLPHIYVMHRRLTHDRSEDFLWLSLTTWNYNSSS